MSVPALMLKMLVWNAIENVKMVTSDCVVEQTSMKAGWRSASIVCGAQSVMISGELLMLLWLVDNLATLSTVRTSLS